MALITRRKASPLAPPCACALRGDAESARNPTLLLELPRTLLRFNVQTPAFDELFQLPPEIGHMLRRFPHHFTISDDPAADHPAQLIYQTRQSEIPMFTQGGRRLVRFLAVLELEIAQRVREAHQHA